MYLISTSSHLFIEVTDLMLAMQNITVLMSSFRNMLLQKSASRFSILIHNAREGYSAIFCTTARAVADAVHLISLSTRRHVSQFCRMASSLFHFSASLCVCLFVLLLVIYAGCVCVRVSSRCCYCFINAGPGGLFSNAGSFQQS